MLALISLSRTDPGDTVGVGRLWSDAGSLGTDSGTLGWGPWLDDLGLQETLEPQPWVLGPRV